MSSQDCHGDIGPVGRLAPSPTGALHLGNARSFLAAWLSIRQQAGKLFLRIEDIDSPRVKPWAVQQTIQDLQWLGLDWDNEVGGENRLEDDVSHGTAEGVSPLALQTERLPVYRKVLDQLQQAGKIYPCCCSRSEIEHAASAPHESRYQPLEGTVYPGTCRRTAKIQQASFATEGSEEGRPFAWRWKFERGIVSWIDGFWGLQTAEPERQLGDFVVGKRDGTPAYQLAVVIDDAEMRVTEVVRGDDLIYSTYRQLAIIKHLGFRIPTYYHLPLVVGADGRRLAKRHGDTRLAWFREQGITPEAAVGFLGYSLGCLPHPQPVMPTQLVGAFAWHRIPSKPIVFDPHKEVRMLRQMSK